MESYSSGRRGGFAKAVGGAIPARVRIPHSPPEEDLNEVFFCDYRKRDENPRRGSVMKNEELATII